MTPAIGILFNADGALGPNLGGTPLCFSWPYLGATLDLTDIQVTLNTGEVLHPRALSTLPNGERNEKHCMVIFMDLGNRIVPTGSNDCARRADATLTPSSCAFYPKKFEIVGDITFVGPPAGAAIQDGPWTQDTVRLVSGKGLVFHGWPRGPHPYIRGPGLIGAHLTRYTAVGDSGKNDGDTLYPLRLCQYRLRFYYTGGYTPNGASGIRPTDYQRYWRLIASNGSAGEVALLSQGVAYRVGGGTVTVVGLAELGSKEAAVVGCGTDGLVPPATVDPGSGGCYDRCYAEDHDNYIDIILTGDDAGMRSLLRLEQPADGSGCYRQFYQGSGPWKPCVGYQPLYNPGGGGNVRNPDPYWGRYVAGSPPGESWNITVDLGNHLFVSYDDGTQSVVVVSLVVAWVAALAVACSCCALCRWKLGRKKGGEGEAAAAAVHP